MLRVCSVLYIERLWNTESPVNAMVGYSGSQNVISDILAQEPSVIQELEPTLEQQDTIESEVLEQAEQEHQEPDCEEEEEEEEQSDTTESTHGVALVAIEEEEAEDQTEQAEEIGDRRRDSKVSSALFNSNDTILQKESDEVEQVVSSLAIDTNQAITNDKQEFSAQAASTSADQSVSISSTSSILPPLTPSSVHSDLHQPVISNNEKPRSTSLIRRETSKLNDKRKSLTRKIKKALTVKSDNNNKRHSI